MAAMSVSVCHLCVMTTTSLCACSMWNRIVTDYCTATVMRIVAGHLSFVLKRMNDMHMDNVSS